MSFFDKAVLIDYFCHSDFLISRVPIARAEQFKRHDLIDLPFHSL